MQHKSHVIILAGPNGAGKTTVAPALLQGALQVNEFVNADIIAQGLSVFKPEQTAWQAGRLMLQRLNQLAKEYVNFAFETTLASRSFAPWLKKLCNDNYEFHLVFLWTPSPEFCIRRVEERISMGGHAVPVDVIRRRYYAGLSNFFKLYKPLATSWYFYNNSIDTSPDLIAKNIMNQEIEIIDNKLWKKIEETYNA